MQLDVSQRSSLLAFRRVGRRLARLPRPRLTLAGGSAEGRLRVALTIAEAQGRDLLSVDLGRVVSQHLAETRRRLRQVLATAERSGALLFFDEADALFGKRSTVAGSHDRYANQEVSYLLQRLARHRGTVLLGVEAPLATASQRCT